MQSAIYQKITKQKKKQQHLDKRTFAQEQNELREEEKVPELGSRGRDRGVAKWIAGPDLVRDSFPQAGDRSCAPRISGHTIHA